MLREISQTGAAETGTVPRVREEGGEGKTTQKVKLFLDKQYLQTCKTLNEYEELSANVYSAESYL